MFSSQVASRRACRVCPALLLLGVPGGVLGGEELERQLGLSAFQVHQLQERRASVLNPPPNEPAQRRPTPDRRPAERLAQAHRGMTRSQEEPAVAASALLSEAQIARLAVISSVFRRYQLASDAIQLGLISPEEWPGGPLCFYPISSGAALFGLSNEQISRLSRLKDQRANPSAALAVLTPGQNAALTSFRFELQLAREAIELGLLGPSPGGEILCH